MNKWREPMSALTHLIGAIIAIPAGIFLVMKACESAGIYQIISLSIFALSLFALYTASTVYHMLPVSEETVKKLKRVDHMMIFVLIAGTYTPICLVPLQGTVGWTMLAVVWGIALFGILLKIFWLNAPRWISTVIYVAMGWVVVGAFVPLVRNVPVGGIVLLTLGGIAYTVGAVIYGTKWPKLNLKNFGFHEIFHLFVLLGSSLHTAFMFMYI